MRIILSGLLVLAGVSAASAEVWQSREGACGDWRLKWNVEQDPDGVWVGSVDHVHVGGPCTQALGKRVRSDVRAVIAGESFFAALRSSGGVCTYYGRIREDRVRGFELCEGSPARISFALRFPPGENREARERYQGREQDEFLDDPQIYEPNQGAADFELPRPRR